MIRNKNKNRVQKRYVYPHMNSMKGFVGRSFILVPPAPYRLTEQHKQKHYRKKHQKTNEKKHTTDVASTMHCHIVSLNPTSHTRLITITAISTTTHNALSAASHTKLTRIIDTGCLAYEAQ